jgi:DNA-binding PadR family transcriptional regulator
MWMETKTFQNGLSNRALNATAASLLGFLLNGPLTGWDIVATVEASIGCFWNLTRSQVYRELRTLAEQGLVEVGATGARDRRPYSITEDGRQAFLHWLRQNPGDDLIRMQGLLKFFFADYLDEKTLRRFVTMQKLEHEQRLAYFREILPDVEKESPLCAHTLRFGIRYEETTLEWLDAMPWDEVGKTGASIPTSI